MWWLSISDIDPSVSSIGEKLSYRRHVHYNPSIKLSTPRDVERIEISSMFFETNYFFKFERIEYKAWKHSAEKYRDQTMTFPPPAAGLKPFYSWVCLLLTFALGNLILRWLTDSHMTIFSKSNYRVRLNVNMNIPDDTISL